MGNLIFFRTPDDDAFGERVVEQISDLGVPSDLGEVTTDDLAFASMVMEAIEAEPVPFSLHSWAKDELRFASVLTADIEKSEVPEGLLATTLVGLNPKTSRVRIASRGLAAAAASVAIAVGISQTTRPIDNTVVSATILLTLDDASDTVNVSLLSVPRSVEADQKAQESRAEAPDVDVADALQVNEELGPRVQEVSYKLELAPAPEGENLELAANWFELVADGRASASNGDAIASVESKGDIQDPRFDGTSMEGSQSLTERRAPARGQKVGATVSNETDDATTVDLGSVDSIEAPHCVEESGPGFFRRTCTYGNSGTPEAGATPVPSSEPSPAPTAAPTAAPSPSATPKPTDSPEPTASSDPSSSPE